MRRLIWLAVIFAALWSGWWFFAAQSLQSGLSQWFEERRAEGWQADVTEIRSDGFPLTLEKTLVNPALADPQTGVAFSTPDLTFSAPVWWPGYVTVTLPSDSMVLANPQTRYAVSATAAQADLRLRPGTALELEQMALTSGPWEVTAPDGSIVAAQGLTLKLQQVEGTPTRYEVTLDAPAFQPGSVPRKAMRIPADRPIAFDSLALDATIDFDRPLDRRTIEDARPQPRQVDLRLAEAVWGALLLRMAATLDVSSEGLLSGEFSMQADNWRDMLTLAEAAGALPAALVPQLDSILGALARGSGNPDTIDVTITLRDGTMFLGFIPLGPAPRLILR